nr:MAG TPA_asm: minor tail protein [Caudoviricetes sp.]
MADGRELVFGLRTKNADKASKDIEKVDKSLDKASDKAKGLEKSAKNAGNSVRSMAKGASKALIAMGNKMKSIGGKMTKMGKSISLAAAPIAGALLGGYKMFLELDKGIRQVSTLADREILPVSKIREETRRISDMSGIAQTEIAGAMYDALSSGVDTSKLVGFTESAVKLTKAGFTDMGTVIDSTTTVLNAYGDKAYDVSKIHDIMVKTQDKGKITVDQLGKSLGRVIPIAAASGVELDQLGASYSILTARGIKAEEATTALRGMLSELSSSGTTADKVLRQKTGKSFKDLTKDGKNLGDVLQILNEYASANGKSLGDMFGNINAQMAANSLASGGPDAYKKMLAEMNNAGGSVDINFDKMMGPAEKLARTTERVKNTLIELGAEASPHIDKLMDLISQLTDKFSELDSGTQGSIVEWGLLLSVIGPVIMVVGQVISIAGTLVGWIGTLIGWLGGLSGIFGVVSGAASAVWSGLTLVCEALGPVGWAALAVIGIGVWLATNFQKIKTRADELGGGLGGYLRATIEAVGDSFRNMGNKAVSAINWVIRKWNDLKNFLAHPIQGIVNIFTGGGGKAVSGGKGGGAHQNNGRGRVGVRSHATGLDYVPYDNYLANLHKGEVVLTAKASADYRAMGGTKDRVPRSGNSTSTNTVNNSSPIFNINIYGNSSPVDTAKEVKKEMDNYFKLLRLQRV